MSITMANDHDGRLEKYLTPSFHHFELSAFSGVYAAYASQTSTYCCGSCGDYTGAMTELGNEMPCREGCCYTCYNVSSLSKLLLSCKYHLERERTRKGKNRG